MPPNNHAERLREMAEIARQEADSYSQIARISLTESAYKAIFTERREKYATDAAALLAGAEALEAVARLRAFAAELTAQNMPVLDGMAYQLDRLLPKERES
jgi:hypothetical protein